MYLSVLHLIQIISSPSFFPAIVMKVTQLRQNIKSMRFPLWSLRSRFSLVSFTNSLSWMVISWSVVFLSSFPIYGDAGLPKRRLWYHLLVKSFLFDPSLWEQNYNIVCSLLLGNLLLLLLILNQEYKLIDIHPNFSEPSVNLDWG